MATTQACKPAAFYVPINFDPLSFPEDERSAACCFLSQVHWKKINWQANQEGFVHLKARYLDRIIPNGTRNDVKYKLLRMGVIESDGITIPGIKCEGFRLAQGYTKTHLTHCTDERMNKKIRNLIEEQRRNHLPVHHWIGKTFNLFDYDQGLSTDLLTKAHKDNEQLRDDRISYAAMFAYERAPICDSYGRVHTLLTSLERGLRCCLTYKGQPLIGLDLKNSQPLFAGILGRLYQQRMIKCRLLAKDFTKEGRTYANLLVPSMAIESPGSEPLIEVCEPGKFYEYMMLRCPPGMTRDEFKELFYQNVLFGKNCWHSQLKDTFNEEFNAIGRMLHDLKYKNYQRSAWILQNLESTIFIYVICNRIMRERPTIPLATIHDSLLTTEEHIPYLRKVIMSTFEAINIKPTLGEQYYGCD